MQRPLDQSGQERLMPHPRDQLDQGRSMLRPLDQSDQERSMPLPLDLSDPSGRRDRWDQARWRQRRSGQLVQAL